MSDASPAADGRDAGILDRIARWAAGDERVRAVLLTSTRAMADAATDRFSDYDVVLYVTDTGAFATDGGWIEGLGEVLVRFGGEGRDGGLPFHMRLVIYRDGEKVDFTIAPVERLREMARTGVLTDALDVGYRVLLDRDGAAAALPAPTGAAHIPPPPSQEEFDALVEEFWWESTYVAKNLWRDELLPARYSLEAVMKLDLLRRMLEWRVETDHGWRLRPGVQGRGLKQHLDPATWAELEATFAGAETEAGWRALFGTARLFRRVALEVAARLRLDYPHQLDDRVMDYLRQIERSGGKTAEGARESGGGEPVRTFRTLHDPQKAEERRMTEQRRMYAELAKWWPLVSPPSHYVEEAEFFLPLLGADGPGSGRTLLELGAGGGSLAFHLKRHFRATLTDLSPEMLAVSAAVNPECEHVPGDMRTLRLGRRFDVVLIHDAICYAADRASAVATLETAAAHCRPGGTLLLVPDHVRETFAPSAEAGGEDGDDGRALRYLEWTLDPDPSDETYEVEYAFVLRDADGTTTVEGERHVEGLFPRDAWLGWLRDAGFDVRTVTDPWDRVVFVGVMTGAVDGE